MIVKDETPVLERLFRSLAPVIADWVIVDTGSTDGTPGFIEQWMARAGIPGELHHRPWVDFGHNRDEALQLALARGRADWLLFIDADEELGWRDPGFVGRLKRGTSYTLAKHHGDIRYRLPALVDVRDNRWRWRGAVHEYLEHLQGPDRRAALDEAWIVYHEGEGSRSRGRSQEDKFLADARLLQAELVREPGNARALFYLAQSLRDAGHAEAALEQYRLRAALKTGWAEEAYCAQVEVGRMMRALDRPFAEVAQAFLQAHQMRPRRAEALHELARLARVNKVWQTAFLVAQEGARLRQPDDQLFVQPEVYAWRLLDELAVAAYWSDQPRVAVDAADELLRRHAAGRAQLPEADLARVRENRALAQARLPPAPKRSGRR